MIFGPSKILGLMLREHSILAAEVHLNGERKTVTRLEEFTFPPDLSLQQPRPLGKALRQFLKQKHFTASRAVVGVSARSLMTREKEVPPSTPAVASNVLRLQAEHDFPSDLKSMAFDYAGQTDPKAPRKVLIVAMLGEHLEQITALADAAGVRLVAVTSSMLALTAHATSDHEGELFLALEPSKAELAVCDHQQPRFLRHLSLGASISTSGNLDSLTIANILGSEIHRTLSAMPPMASSLAHRKLLLWNGNEFSPTIISALGQRAGIPVEVARDLSPLAIQLAADTPNAVRFAMPIALALSGAKSKSAPINFLHSRLAPPRTRRLGRRAGWAAALAAIAVMGLGYLAFDINARQTDLDQLKADLRNIDPDLRAAETLSTKINAVHGWYEGRSPYLTCLEKLTRLFPDNGQIWATTLSMRETVKQNNDRKNSTQPETLVFTGVLNGRAVDQKNVLMLIDQMNKSGFPDAKLMDMREAGGNSRDVAFVVSFTFNTVE